MDGREMSQSDRGGKQEEQVPTSPCASYEKPRVPLNNLKMKFERGEEALSKVFIVLYVEYIYIVFTEESQSSTVKNLI